MFTHVEPALYQGSLFGDNPYGGRHILSYVQTAPCLYRIYAGAEVWHKFLKFLSTVTVDSQTCHPENVRLPIFLRTKALQSVNKISIYKQHYHKQSFVVASLPQISTPVQLLLLENNVLILVVVFLLLSIWIDYTLALCLSLIWHVYTCVSINRSEWIRAYTGKSARATRFHV